MAKISSWLADNLHSCIDSNDFQRWLPSTPLDSIDPSALEVSGIELQMLRLDALCPHLGGNKIFKLFGHLRNYLNNRVRLPIASFGGAHSNHLYALAHACNILGIPCTGFIRGETPAAPSDTLRDLSCLGMALRYLSRSEYRRRHQPEFCRSLGGYYWIPEGGGGVAGVAGCIELGRYLAKLRPDAVVLACGTGTTYAGVRLGVDNACPVMGISALKGALGDLRSQVCDLIAHTPLESSKNGVQNFREPVPDCMITDEFHCGGFARYPGYLAEFVQSFETNTGILLDPVYTSKLVWGIKRIGERGGWKRNPRVIAVHSGGLQGRRGYNL